jgi:hypothetical protein
MRIELVRDDNLISKGAWQLSKGSTSSRLCHIVLAAIAANEFGGMKSRLKWHARAYVRGICY